MHYGRREGAAAHSGSHFELVSQHRGWQSRTSSRWRLQRARCGNSPAALRRQTHVRCGSQRDGSARLRCLAINSSSRRLASAWRAGRDGRWDVSVSSLGGQRRLRSGDQVHEGRQGLRDLRGRRSRGGAVAAGVLPSFVASLQNGAPQVASTPLTARHASPPRPPLPSAPQDLLFWEETGREVANTALWDLVKTDGTSAPLPPPPTNPPLPPATLPGLSLRRCAPALA